MKRFLATIAAAALSVATAFSAQAAPLQNALSIVIDGSGSISGTDFQTQKNAYATVLGDPSILVADGSVAINLIQFSSTAQIEQTAIRINSEADRTTLLNSINAMTQLGGLTAIGDGINLGVNDMDTFLSGLAPGEFGTNFDKIVDVSTDGGNNSGASPTTATDNAIAAGYAAVNCLAVGSGNCSFMAGDGTVFNATDFNNLLPVLEQKVRTELDVPVPASMALLGMGLIGFGAVARRRKLVAA